MRFTGEQLDATGQYHLRARQYDSGLGRFTGPDPVDTGTGVPYVSTYAYVANQPTTQVDPTGQVKRTPGQVCPSQTTTLGLGVAISFGTTSCSNAAETLGGTTSGGRRLGKGALVGIAAILAALAAFAGVTALTGADSIPRTDDSVLECGSRKAALTNPNCDENVYFHFTDEAGATAIESSGVIRANDGKVYLSKSALSPDDAFNTLFIGNPEYAGKGDYVATLRVYDGVEVIPLNPPLEYVHYGSMRTGRHIDILSVSRNRF